MNNVYLSQKLIYMHLFTDSIDFSIKGLID
jgi:hypothetical protein